MTESTSSSAGRKSSTAMSSSLNDQSTPHSPGSNNANNNNNTEGRIYTPTSGKITPFRSVLHSSRFSPYNDYDESSLQNIDFFQSSQHGGGADSLEAFHLWSGKSLSESALKKFTDTMDTHGIGSDAYNFSLNLTNQMQQGKPQQSGTQDGQSPSASNTTTNFYAALDQQKQESSAKHSSQRGKSDNSSSNSTSSGGSGNGTLSTGANNIKLNAHHIHEQDAMDTSPDNNPQIQEVQKHRSHEQSYPQAADQRFQQQQAAPYFPHHPPTRGLSSFNNIESSANPLAQDSPTISNRSKSKQTTTNSDGSTKKRTKKTGSSGKSSKKQKKSKKKSSSSSEDDYTPPTREKHVSAATSTTISAPPSEESLQQINELVTDSIRALERLNGNLSVLCERKNHVEMTLPEHASIYDRLLPSIVEKFMMFYNQKKETESVEATHRDALEGDLRHRKINKVVAHSSVYQKRDSEEYLVTRNRPINLCVHYPKGMEIDKSSIEWQVYEPMTGRVNTQEITFNEQFSRLEYPITVKKKKTTVKMKIKLRDINGKAYETDFSGHVLSYCDATFRQKVNAFLSGEYERKCEDTDVK